MTRTRSLLFATLLVLLPATAHAARTVAYTRDLDLETCTFTIDTDNPFLPLVPGFGSELVTFRRHQEIELKLLVLAETQVIAGVETRVVQVSDEVEDVPWRVRRLYVAQCARNGSLFLFGVDVDEHDASGDVVGHQGSWRAGSGGAQVGLLMPGIALLGSRWLEEQAPGVATTGEELVAMNRVFSNSDIRPQGCIVVVETPLDRHGSTGAPVSKTYCPGIGLVRQGTLSLAGD